MCNCDLCLREAGETYMTLDGDYACVECYYLYDEVDGFEDAVEPDECGT